MSGAVTLDDVADFAMSLPDVEEGTTYGNRAWKVGGKAFVWERPFSKADLRRFGDDPVRAGPIVGVRCDDLEDTRAILASDVAGVFTIPHFDGFAAVLVHLEAVDREDLRELLVDGWLACAPAALRNRFLAERDD